jgi:enoyl-CoA hydratase
VIHAERRDDVALLTIDRPQRRNAVDYDTLDQLGRAITDSDGCRVLVLTGAGGHFCAGADLTGLEDSSFARSLHEVLALLHQSPLVTLAAVEGAALGAGTQLAAACDLRVATRDARFGIPAARLGLMVDLWTVHRVAILAGQATARAMLLTCEQVSGEDAHRLGLVQRLGGLDDAMAWAADIAVLAPLTIQGHKLGLNLVEPAVTDAAGGYDEAFARAWQSQDLVEGITAFREKRTPQFRGR